MRLTTVILIASLMQLSAAGLAQKVTLSEKQAALTKVFDQISSQTGYDFLFTTTLLKNAKPVSIQVNNANLEQVLKQIFENQPFQYTIGEKSVVVKEKAPSFLDKAVLVIQSAAKELAAIDATGTVLDEKGQPLPGATVKLKDGKAAAMTDQKGRFLLRNVQENAVIVISYTGYVSKEVSAKENMGNIALSLSDNPLDQVQVIAYGKTSQRYTVGNSITISGDVIDRQPVTNPLFALQGLVPGLLVTQKTGLAGGAFTAQIQGQNSIANGSDPFIVVDGVPIAYELFGGSRLNGPLSAGDPLQAVNSPVNFINPSDIESITVLKDADATAIYGSRAANGAILIVTKKGKAGKPKISLNLQNGWGKVGKEVEMLNTRQYLDMRYEALKNSGQKPTSSDFDLTSWDTTRYTNWQKELIGGTAKYSNLNASISGGSELVQYLVGATLDKVGTVFPGDFASKTGTVHANINISSQDQRFKLGLTSSYAINSNGVPGVDLTRAALFLAPNAPPLYNSDGTLNWAPHASGTSTFDNPMANNIFESYEHGINTLTSNVNISYDFLPGLSFKSSLGYNNIQGNTFWANSLQSVPPEYYGNGIRQSGLNNISSFSWIAEPQLTFNKSFNKLSLNALLGSTFQKNKSQYTNTSASGFVSDQLVRDFASATLISSRYERSIYKYNAVFGRIGLIYDKKYMVNFSSRRDGSSRFGDANPFNSFWSVGGGWIFTEENVFKKALPFLSFGKLRASYGVAGNDQIGEYAYLNLYSPTLTDFPYQGAKGLSTNGLPNPRVQWESTLKLLGGIDLGFFKDRLVVNASYSRNRSSNQLLSYPLPRITGAGAVVQNFPASVQNTSWEFMLNASAIKRDQFVWNISANMTIPRNQLHKFPGIENTVFANPLNGVNIGQPLGAIPYYHYLGVDPFTGRYLFANENNQPVFAGRSDVGGRTIFINTRPTCYGGLTSNFNYKGFTLDFILQFVRQKAPRRLYFWNDENYPGVYPGSYSNQPLSILDRWQKPGDAASIEGFNSLALGDITIPISDAYFSYDASYLRLKNLSLSWQLPTVWLKAVRMQGGSLSFSGQNLATFTRYSGLDPESQSSTSLPPLKVYTLNLNVSF